METYFTEENGASSQILNVNVRIYGTMQLIYQLISTLWHSINRSTYGRHVIKDF